jgi:hypothetical protein
VKRLSRTGSEQRRAAYCENRLEGMSSYEAAQSVGVTSPDTRRLYERWFLSAHPEVTPEAPGRQFLPYRAWSAS